MPNLLTIKGLIEVKKDKLMVKKKFKQSELLKNYDYSKNTARTSINLSELKKNKIIKNEKDYLKELHDFFFFFFKKRIRDSYSEDKLIVLLIQAYEEAERISNLLYERLIEFLSAYYPRITSKDFKMKKLSEVVSKTINKKELSEELKIPADEMGWELKEEAEIIKEHANQLKKSIKYQEKLEQDIENLMNKVAPNVTKLCGALLGAKLISSTGGLKRLAELPSSTIQVLGAEKALFRHLRTGGKPPKHGFLLQHPLVLNTKQSERGRAARKLASKISIAARVDYFRNKKNSSVGEELLEEMRGEMK